MKKNDIPASLTKREMRIAAKILDHFSGMYPPGTQVKGFKSTDLEIKKNLPARTASLKTLRHVAEKSALFTLEGNTIEAASKVWANVTYTITGARSLKINSDVRSIDGGTVRVELSLPGYRFTVETDTATPNGNWQFTASKIIVVLTEQRRAQQGTCTGHGPGIVPVTTIAIP